MYTCIRIHFSVRIPLKLKIKQCQIKKVTKKEESLNLMLAEPTEARSLAFLVSLC